MEDGNEEGEIVGILEGKLVGMKDGYLLTALGFIDGYKLGFTVGR